MDLVNRNPTAQRTRATLIALALIGAGVLFTSSSCSESEPIPSADKQRAGASPPPAAVKLTVLVAGDEELAEGIQLLSGEWKARNGGELTVTTATLDELDAAKELSADVVIFPSRWLGVLAERGVIRPMRDSVLSSPQLALNDIFPAIRNGEMRYGGLTMALPLGSPPLLMYWQPGLGGEPQSSRVTLQSWEAYRAWIGVGAEEVKPTTPPLAGRAAAYTLIARSSAYVEATRRPEALFDSKNMSPRITEPPWIRALAQITEETPEPAQADPAGFPVAMAAVRSGASLATLGWPGISSEANSVLNEAAESAAFALLPTAESVYSQTLQDWENQLHPQSVTLLGVEGRLLAVTVASRNAVSAFALCQWLTRGDIAVQLSSRSDGTLWYRKSQAPKYGRWMEKAPTGGATSVTQIVAEAMTNDTPVIIPRVPGIDEYLDVLAEAVRSATSGESDSREALATAAATWEEITERLGQESQSRAYRRHLGLEAFEPE